MLVGSKAGTKYMADAAFSKAANAKNKELFLVEGNSHIQTYWETGILSQAVNKWIQFYQTNL